MNNCVLAKAKQVISVPVRLPEELAGASEDFLRRNAAVLQGLGPAMPASKYHNARAQFRSMTFASGREAKRAGELVLLEEQRQIFALRFQVGFPLPGGVKYIADAVYCELRDGELQVVIEDSKGFRTKEYKLKKRLFEERYGIKIRET